MLTTTSNRARVKKKDPRMIPGFWYRDTTVTIAPFYLTGLSVSNCEGNCRVVLWIFERVPCSRCVLGLAPLHTPQHYHPAHKSAFFH